MDDELSERARRLVEVGMVQDVPPDVVVEDSWGMVISRVTADTERSSEPPVVPAVASAPARGQLRIVVTVAIVATLLGGAWFALRPSSPATAPSLPARPSSPSAATVPTAKPDPIAEPAPRAADAATLLDDAEAALATAPVRALELVDQHAARTPAIDADRRMALRIAILCALGRTEEAEAEATAFLAIERVPEWSARVRASCGGAGVP